MKIKALLWATGLAGLMFSCSPEPESRKRLQALDPSTTGITFENRLTSTSEFNIVEYLYFYNGAGVAAGDINNDGLEDLYFSSNQGPNRLYLNRGDFRFEDITEKSGVAAGGNWKTGVNMVDINQDGWLDLFVCGVGGYKSFNGYNQVFINNGDRTFTESAESLGLAFQGFSTQTAFFDFDLDGDLDMYLLNHSVHSVRSMGTAELRLQSNREAGDKLYENRLVPEGVTHFKEITQQAGIIDSALGYGLGLAISDLNNDGLPDIYVSNDFHENDYLYLNLGGGKFRQVAEQSMGHTSRFSMGNAAADFNNDARTDVVSLDMLPADEAVLKASAGEDPFDIFEYKMRLGFHYQYARNALQLNRGNLKDGTPLFSDIAPYAGIEATDWSWSPLAADFDNDGWKDLYITNGIVRRPNDMDYIAFISSDSAQRFLQYEDFLEHMPSGKVRDAIFRNSGNGRFQDVSADWTRSEPDLSNGAAYADLDLDGDLDVVVNRIDAPALVLRNQTDTLRGLVVELEAPVPNRAAYGSRLTLFSNGITQMQEHQPSRGFQSSVSQRIHFGLGKAAQADSLVIQWPDGTVQTEHSLKPGNVIHIKKSSYRQVVSLKQDDTILTFKEMDSGPVHTEDQFSAFSQERLLPYSLDSEGPRLHAADLDGNGKKDLIISGNASAPTRVWWDENPATEQKLEVDITTDVTAVTTFDADGDGRTDILLSFGGQRPDSSFFANSFKPLLLINRGGRRFVSGGSIPPDVHPNAGAVASADVDGDGDTDVFIGASLVPGRFGEIPESHLLINDGKGHFISDEKGWLPSNSHLGFISDAQFADINTDGRPDLILAGMWMPIRILENDGRKFTDQTEKWGLTGTSGWWHRIACGDFDNDGDIDLIGGNHGQNFRLRATPDKPVKLYVADLDHNGSTDPILEYAHAGGRFPFLSRDQLVKQVPSLKRTYLRYSAYQQATVDQIIKAAGYAARPSVFEATTFASMVMLQQNGKMVPHELPAEAQFAPVFAIGTADLNGDKLTDFVIGGNFFGSMTEVGRLDAGIGLVLLNQGAGRFNVQNGVSSGLLLRGSCKDLVISKMPDGAMQVFAALNQGPLLRFRYKD